jgi:hypothetical protein
MKIQPVKLLTFLLLAVICSKPVLNQDTVSNIDIIKHQILNSVMDYARFLFANKTTQNLSYQLFSSLLNIELDSKINATSQLMPQNERDDLKKQLDDLLKQEFESQFDN